MGRPRLPRSVEMAFWELTAQGLSANEASSRLGVSNYTGSAWFREAGGVNPRIQPPKLRFSFEERCRIEALLEVGLSQRRIAARLGRSSGAVCREINRNGSSRGYHASTAQSEADRVAKRPQETKLAANPRLCQRVQDLLKARWSPEQIAARLRRECRRDRVPEQTGRVCTETIYRSLFIQGRGELRRDLTRCLRTGRAMRKPRGRAQRGDGSGKIPDMLMISERPAEADDRSVPGHWEGDLILGKDNASAVGTLVERTTRYLLLLHLPHGHGAEQVRDAMLAKIPTLPDHLWRSLTWDQGKEMAQHRKITIQTGLPIYFCEPASPWMRGSNENTNGLTRQYLPKGTDLSVHSEAELDEISAEMNGRPRKTLDWDTPAEAMNALLSGPYPAASTL